MDVMHTMIADDTTVPRPQRRASGNHTAEDGKCNSVKVGHSKYKGQLGTREQSCFTGKASL